MTTNENAKKWTEGIAQDSIYDLIQKYYKTIGKPITNPDDKAQDITQEKNTI